MESVVIKKENGRVRLANIDMDLIREIKNPCFVCENGFANLCPKIADAEDKDISRYDFITDGYQVNNEKGKVKNFVVCKCNNFKEQKARPESDAVLRRRANNMNSIKIIVFDAIDPKEADRIQRELYARGALLPYSPSENKTK